MPVTDEVGVIVEFDDDVEFGEVDAKVNQWVRLLTVLVVGLSNHLFYPQKYCQVCNNRLWLQLENPSERP